MADRVGQRFGDYLLVRYLGEGGFGDVYLGEHVHNKSQAAVKILKTHLKDDTDAMEFANKLIEFINEASTFNLQHPNIARLITFGVRIVKEEKIPFLVLEYAPNGSLRNHHRHGEQLPLSTIVSYVKQIASALQYAHDQRRIHRDVKPENILLGPNNEILLSDFGIAAFAHSTESWEEQKQTGTPNYSAPEQIKRKALPASDQYSLAVMVYEWLCGTPPFKGNIVQVMYQHLEEAPPSLREQVPTIPLGVEQVVLKALAKHPKERFVSVQAFADALEEASKSKSSFPLPGTTLLTYKGHSKWVNAVAWLPDGSRIASNSYGETVQVWEAPTGKLLLTYQRYTFHESPIAWSPDGTRFACISSLEKESYVEVWNAATEQKLLSCGSMYEDVLQVRKSLVWSPDSVRLASAGYDFVYIWNSVTGKELRRYPASLVSSLAWSPDGTRLVSVSSHNIVYLWEAVTGNSLLSYQDHTSQSHVSSISAVAWSPDGSRIASSLSNKTVQVWEANTGKLLLSYHGHTNLVSAVTWSPDGTRIASASVDGMVQVWQAV